MSTWADDHGYWHWKCRDCGMSGWTDTTPDCGCARCAGCQKVLARDAEGDLCDACQREDEADRALDELEEKLQYQEGAPVQDDA